MKNIILFFTIILLGGCATTDPVINTVVQRVEVPIAMPCAAEIPLQPEFNFNKMTIENDIFEKTRAVLADQELHTAYETELLAALKSCK